MNSIYTLEGYVLEVLGEWTVGHLLRWERKC